MVATRLMARLREHDWLSVVTELVVVVLGILIALQVSNWNQGRLDRARAQNYYERIHTDLLTDQKNMDITLAFWAKVSAYGREAIAHGETGIVVDGSEWKTVLAYYQASQTFPFVETDRTFAEMGSVGDLGLIANQHLRAQLESYYSLSGVGGQSIIHEQDPVYRKEIRGLTPWPVQQYIWSRCFSESSYLAQQFIDCPSPISDREAATILANYKQSATLLDDLRTWMSQLRVSSVVLANTRRDATELATEVSRQDRFPSHVTQ